MARNIEEIRKIAAATRADFEAAAITDSELLELANRYVPQDIAIWEEVLAAGRPKFPAFSCDFTTIVLRHRIGYGDVTKGSYESFVHTFLHIGQTAIADRTIVDIASDMYGGPPIYIGELTHPWSEAQDWLIEENE